MNIGTRVSFLAAAGSALDGYDIIIMAAAVGLIANTLHVTSASEKAFLVSIAFLFSFIGAIAFGVIVDKFGRRIIFLSDLILFIGGALITGLAFNVPELLIGRAMIGLAIGADIASGWTMVNEFAKKEVRGSLVAMQAAIWTIAAGVGYFILYAFLPYGSSLVWRIAFLLGIILAVPVIIIRRSLPESPRWLYTKGKITKDEFLGRLKQINDGKEVDPSVLNEVRPKSSVLFSKKYIRRTIGASGSQFIYALVGTPVYLFTTEILLHAGYSNKFGSLLLGGGYIYVLLTLYIVFAMWLMNKIPRRTEAIIASLGITASLFILWIHPFSGAAFFVEWAVFGFFLNMLVPVLWAWGSELFPTSIRGLSQGATMSANRLASFFGASISGVLILTGGEILVFQVYSILAVLLVLLVGILINVEPFSKELELVG